MHERGISGVDPRVRASLRLGCPAARRSAEEREGGREKRRPTRRNTRVELSN